MGKIQNTLKVMGVSGMNALLFEDSLECYHLTISPTVKQKYFDQMMNTIVNKKAFKEHYLKLLNDSDNEGDIRISYEDLTIFSVSSHNIRVVLNTIFAEFCRDTCYKPEEIASVNPVIK